MATINASEYWENRYTEGGNSGYGSYGEQLDKKLKWLSGLDINSISEIGCGDFNFGNELLKIYPKATYFGTDVSETIVDRNKKLFPKYTFKMAKEEIPKADLVMCIDVLFHVLDENDLEKILSTLDKKFTKYLAITAYEREEDLGTHVAIRTFDFKRFGEPVIRQIVEEDGELYFYLFKKPTVNLQKVSCCLNTKDHVYPQEILDHIKQFNFGEILINTDSDSPHRKHELFAKAKYDLIYYQDDDAICPIAELVWLSDPKMINVAMKQGHFESYADKKMTMGLGWGAIFPKNILKSLEKYTNIYGFDEIYKRETERILTSLNFPQNRLVLPIKDLPSAYAQDRLWRQPRHYDYIPVVEERCKDL